jgi:predicted Rossmann fold nucleotide-binding protein DprA/Smf involved in DNA uptake
MTRELREIVREEPLVRDTLLDALQAGPLSIPELATAAGFPPDEVMIWIMGLRKYGYVAEQPEAGADGYFRYAAVRHS